MCWANVGMALGETHVVDLTKKMLRENGVNVAALEVEKTSEKRLYIYMNVCVCVCVCVCM